MTAHLVDLLLNDGPPREGRRITISVYLSHPTDSKLASEAKNQVLISAISVSGKTKWDILDVTVKRSFKEYCLRIDPSTNLGLNAESVNCYQIGEITRSKGRLRTWLDNKISQSYCNTSHFTVQCVRASYISLIVFCRTQLARTITMWLFGRRKY